MNFIVAVDNNYAIGYNGKLIYSLPSDLKYFKHQTKDKVVVMGANTYFSLPKRPLPNRVNIVLTKTIDNIEGAITCHSFNELFSVLESYNTNDVFVIGGASIYNKLMPYCSKAYITKINSSHDADTYINNIEELNNWHLIQCSETFSENGLSFKFCIFQNDNIINYNSDLTN